MIWTLLVGAREGAPPSEAELRSWRVVHQLDRTEYDAVIAAAALYYALPQELVKAVIAVESSFRALAVSPKGAQGLMQLMPATAAAMHAQDPFDPVDNIYAGARYLRVLANRFQGDIRLTIAAYNAGPEAVGLRHAVPNIPETQVFVSRVVAIYAHYLNIGGSPLP